MLIHSMAEASLSATQALKSVKIYAQHYLKTTWYLNEEAKVLKERVEKEGSVVNRLPAKWAQKIVLQQSEKKNKS